MYPSPNQQVRDWLENDLMAFMHLKHCMEMKSGPEQIAGFLNAVVNTMVEKGEWAALDPEQVNWKELGNEASGILHKRAHRLVSR